MQGRPPAPSNQPGQWAAGPRPPYGANGYEARMQAPVSNPSAAPWGEGPPPSSNYNPVGQPTGPPRPMMPPSSQPFNGSNIPPMRPPFSSNNPMPPNAQPFPGQPFQAPTTNPVALSSQDRGLQGKIVFH